MLAKTVTTLDVVSGGRAVLGIGAGWFELEHQQLGFEFGTFTDRFERLDEALQIIAPMLRGERPTFDGKWYHTETAINEPRHPGRPADPARRRRREEDVRPGRPVRPAPQHHLRRRRSCPASSRRSTQRCAEAGRDRSSLETSFLAFVMIDEDGDRAREQQREYMRGPGSTWTRCPTRTRRRPPPGSSSAPRTRSRPTCRPGCSTRAWTGCIVNLVTNGHEPGIVELTGRTLRKLLG